MTTLDVIIPVLHGANGEDGSFQGILQATGIPYAGCDVLASANGMDKITMKMILRACDIPVVDYTWFTDQQWSSDPDAVIAQVEKALAYPVIVKPADLGSSVGIARADNRETLAEKITEAAKYSTRLIVEHLVEQLKEINCSVLGTCDDYRTSVLEEPIKPEKFSRIQTSTWEAAKAQKVCKPLPNESRPNWTKMSPNASNFSPERRFVYCLATE